MGKTGTRNFWNGISTLDKGFGDPQSGCDHCSKMCSENFSIRNQRLRCKREIEQIEKGSFGNKNRTFQVEDCR